MNTVQSGGASGEDVDRDACGKGQGVYESDEEYFRAGRGVIVGCVFWGFVEEGHGVPFFFFELGMGVKRLKGVRDESVF